MNRRHFFGKFAQAAAVTVLAPAALTAAAIAPSPPPSEVVVVTVSRPPSADEIERAVIDAIRRNSNGMRAAIRRVANAKD